MSQLKLMRRRGELPMTSTLVDTAAIRVETPDGTMFVLVDEDVTTQKPIAIRINIGKAGSPLMAWASAAAELVTLLLESGIDAHKILEKLTDIHSDKLAHSSGIPIYSGPDGLANALLLYLKHVEEEKYERGESGYRRPFIKRNDEQTLDRDKGELE